MPMVGHAAISQKSHGKPFLGLFQNAFEGRVISRLLDDAGSANGAIEHSATTLALSTARLPLVLERIASLRRELIALLQEDAAPDDVYQLEINFFPVTNLQHDKENTSGTTRDAVADSGQATG